MQGVRSTAIVTNKIISSSVHCLFYYFSPFLPSISLIFFLQKRRISKFAYFTLFFPC